MSSNGSDDGSIMATIIVNHMAANMVAAPARLWSAIGIQTMLMVQPPGIGMTPAISLESRIVTPQQTPARRRPAIHVPRAARVRPSDVVGHIGNEPVGVAVTEVEAPGFHLAPLGIDDDGILEDEAVGQHQMRVCRLAVHVGANRTEL